ncbi:glycosyltransferase family 2 protein [Bifidobacterium vespertilionis]|nr:glycosyltransferase family 2 protein [Bifidobacterium vespertilionis]
MSYSIECMCRGDGKGYAKITGEGLRADRLVAVAEAKNGQTIVCGIYPYAFPNEDPTAVRRSGDEHALDNSGIGSCVVAMPLLDGTDLQIRLYDRGTEQEGGTEQNGSTAVAPVFEFPFKALASKIKSRLAYKFHPELASEIRGFDQRRLAVSPYLYVTGIFPVSPSEVSVRFTVRFPKRDMANGDIAIRVLDASATPIDATPMIIEDTDVFTRGDFNAPMWERVYAVRIPKDPRTLCIEATQDGHGHPYGNFTCILAPMFEGFVNGTLNGTRNAYHEPSYPSWFERRRANVNDLAAQRDAIKAWEYQPKISVVSVLFNTPAAYLTAMLDSVLGQSYANFELVLVNVSGRNAQIDAILDRYRDPRIRIMEAENKNIADNTNVGIAASTGDYIAFVDHDDVIEPDALYQYVSALQDDRGIDLMYCDEDRLDNGEYNHPFFKPQFNRDWLYAYNYVTHMLMVSRHALSQIELSGADVAGAQDYDMILKISEVARSIRAIPYVLYHWRIHQGSTSSNPGSKPYADDAGRLALSRHFERIGVKATVRESELPFRYRTEYARDHDPKVSIVIPTKDHAAMLAQCVDSVLRKTEYQNYDITLVENNSVEPETFAYYERIQKESDKVRVVTWEGHGFNYSAICNYGAKQSDGEIILFLNNDTEVIAPEWLGAMVNYMARPDVGVVGAKLICRDGIVSHGGVWVSVNNVGYMGYDLAADDSGYMETMRYPYNPEAITGACQMIPRALFEQLGGLDESLAVVLNDVDLCLKAEQAGYVTVFEPKALLYHNEHTSRGRDENDPRKQRRADDEYGRFFLKWNPVLRPGRFINLNLNQYDGNYKIRY